MKTKDRDYFEGQIRALQYIVMMLYAGQTISTQRVLAGPIHRGLDNMSGGLLEKTDEFIAGVDLVKTSFTDIESAAKELAEHATFVTHTMSPSHVLSNKQESE